MSKLSVWSTLLSTSWRLRLLRSNSLSGSFGEILGGTPVRVFLCDRPVSSIHPSNELMRRCLLRWEYETPRRAFCRIWQRFLHGSFKDRFSGHLATRCGIKCHSLAPKIARLLPGSGFVYRSDDGSGLSSSDALTLPRLCRLQGRLFQYVH